MLNDRRIPLLAAATAVTALVGLGAFTGAASAATPRPVATRAAAAAMGSVSFTSHARARITCEMVFIGANNGAPHHSGHVPGTINVRVRVTCSRPVASIKATVALFSNTGSKINPYRSAGVATARGNAAKVCEPGHYQGVSEATVTAPPGFTPHTGKLSHSTAEVQIREC